jgi:hypothetical protein
MPVILLGAYDTALRWMEANMLSCPSKKYLHIDCPGCGMQRSFLLLLKGDWLASLQMYPATIPILGLLAFLSLHLKYQFRNGAIIIKYLYLAIAILVAVFYIYKILNHKINT